MNNHQFTLPVHVLDDASFTNFYASKNSELVSLLSSHIGSSLPAFFYLWGGEGVGKSHLLQASASYAQEKNQTSVYLSLGEPSLHPSVLEGFEDLSLVCLDDVHQVVGKPDWENALFRFYNLLLEKKHSLILSSFVSPRQLMCQLPDLQSRFGWGMVFYLPPLTDEEKMLILQFRAEKRGLQLSQEVIHFLFHHCSREMKYLLSMLDKLDKASLREKRSLSIPFVKNIFPDLQTK